MAESSDALGLGNNYEEAVEQDKTNVPVQEAEEGKQEEEGEEDDADDDNNGDYDDEEEEEEEEEYSFRFKEGVNPLDFVEDNALSGQPYKQFERLEYEALAEKKRKALADSHRREGSIKKARVEDASRATMEEIMKAMNYGVRRKSREPKKRGRQKGSKNKPNREVVQKLGEATLYYAHGRYEEIFISHLGLALWSYSAISVLHQIVLKAPHLPDAYHTLGLVHTAMDDTERALGFYMLAAHLMPKDSSLWKLLVSWSTEKGDIAQANYCLTKAITADPNDIQLRLLRASLYLELRDAQKAAESYDQIYQLCPENVEALKTGAKLYKRCGLVERSIHILEDYLNNHPTEADLSVIDLLASILMETNEHSKALQHIEHALLVYCSGKELPFNLTVKAAICHIYLGNMKKAEMLFGVLQTENAAHHIHFGIEVADTLMSLGHYDFALMYYLMLEGIPGSDKGFLHLMIARCYISLKDRIHAIIFFQKGAPVSFSVFGGILLCLLLFVVDGYDRPPVHFTCARRKKGRMNGVAQDKEL
ncbi:General transcription factor 3C polypeptide 3 [Morus notabilis]|uniref:General transcription factor 3C polypeptide 3 n=1 Tax=Morus notabilis TaxID=981085 RepID=W9SL48_9ROSA|nr:General transcription factor 3C polypeptide 3 [Morus notabilis]